MIALKFCKVCDRTSQGIHFGVSSCRACAAFFRRRAGSNLVGLSCMSSKCGVDFYLCKPCRLQRCYAVGMDANKFQFDRDAITSTESPLKIPRSFDKFVGRPQFVHFCDPDVPTSSKFIDLTFLVEKGEKILKCGPSWGPHSNKGPLQKLANFHDVFEKLPKNMATNSSFSPGDCSDCWEYYFLTTATWLTNFDEFQKLSHPLKMKILLGIWHMWGRMDKLASTALARRRNQLTVKSEIAQSNGLFLDVDKLELDVSWLCNYSLEEVEFFIDGFRQWDLMETVQMFIELDPSPIELNYMLAQMCFYYAGNRFQGEILEIMERFQQVLSDDLHSYYVNDRKMSNYSGRLTRLMKINNAVQKMENKVPACEICGFESQGYHFGVLACRACSAFFRRTATSAKWSMKPCQKPKLCRDGKGGFHCKPCRLKRCYDVGMDTKKFQFDRDGLVQPFRKVPRSFEMFVGRPEYVLFCTPGTSAQISYPKTLIDVSNLVEKASAILLEGPEKPLIARDQLHKLAIGFSFLENTSTKMKEFNHSTKEDVLNIWEFYFLTVAKWLTYFDEFQKLDHGIQLKLLMAIWHVWGRLDKLLATAVNRRRGICPTKNLLTLSNGVLIDMDKQEVDVEWMTNYNQEQVLTFIDGVRARELVSGIDPLVDLEPSDIETAYMLAQLSFHYAGKRFPGEIETICDHFQDILAANLHDYYKNDKKMERYSGRLAKLMKINGAVQKNIWENRSKIEISKMFNMLSIEISHPEMFYDTGF